jgi:hypothetical protein
MMIAHTLAYLGGPVSGEGGPLALALAPLALDAQHEKPRTRSPDKA